MAEHICPWWMGYVLACPVRRFLEKPEELVGTFLSKGMNVLDYGCGMGFFSLPMARIIGDCGRVFAVDIQEKMLRTLMRRAKRAHLSNIDPVTPEDLRLISDRVIDFVAAIHVVHELPDPKAFFAEMKRIMKPNSKMLVIEPKFHVSEKDFLKSIEFGLREGFTPTSDNVPAARALVLKS